MTQEIITSSWSADRSTLAERISQALEAVDKMFERGTFWRATPQRASGPEDKFLIGTDVEDPDIGKLSDAWDKTVRHFTSRKKDLDDLFVRCAAYSDQLKLSVGLTLNESKLVVETEPQVTSLALGKHLDFFLELLRGIGKAPAIGACWFRHHSAFAGDPVYLYEPAKPFSKFNSPLTYDEVIEEVRDVRESVRKALTIDELQDLLRDLGLGVEIIKPGKVFARIGDPKKERENEKVLRDFEKRLSAAIKR